MQIVFSMKELLFLFLNFQFMFLPADQLILQSRQMILALPTFKSIQLQLNQGQTDPQLIRIKIDLLHKILKQDQHLQFLTHRLPRFHFSNQFKRILFFETCERMTTLCLQGIYRKVPSKQERLKFSWYYQIIRPLPGVKENKFKTNKSLLITFPFSLTALSLLFFFSQIISHLTNWESTLNSYKMLEQASLKAHQKPKSFFKNSTDHFTLSALYQFKNGTLYKVCQPTTNHCFPWLKGESN